MNFIDLKSQQRKILPNIQNRFERILASIHTLWDRRCEVEDQLAEYCKVKHAITCSSGTDALLIPMALGVGPGDAVLPLLHACFSRGVSIWELLECLGVYDSTFNIDCNKLEAAIKNTISDGKLFPKVIIPVDLFGVPARYRIIDKIAKKYDLTVISDGAQSFGGKIRDEKVGTFGDITATSFYPAKPLGCYGDGGAIFTDDDALANKCKSIRIHGTEDDKYNSTYIGLNGRLDTFQAAVLLEKLSIFDNELEQRENISSIYRKNFDNAQYIPADYQSAHALFSIVLDSNHDRAELVNKLENNMIPSVIYYKNPIHLMPAYKYLNYSKGDLPVSESLSDRILSLQCILIYLQGI